MNKDLLDWASLAGNIAQILSLPLTVAVWYFTKETWAKFWNRAKKWVFLFAAILTLITLYRLGVFGTVWTWLKHPAPIPVWLLIVGGLVLVIVPAAILALINRIRNLPEPVETISPEQYTEDVILGVIWRWDYHNGNIDARFFHAFCPMPGCGHRLDAKEDFDRTPLSGLGIGVPALITHVCPRCHFKNPYQLTATELPNRAAQEVERLVNSGEYKTRIKQAREQTNEPKQVGLRQVRGRNKWVFPDYR